MKSRRDVSGRIRAPYRLALRLCIPLLSVIAILIPAQSDASSLKGVGHLPGDIASSVWGISADGSVVVGESRSDSNKRAFRWSNGTVAAVTPPLGGNFTESVATGVSADGAVIVGNVSISNIDVYWAGTCTCSYPYAFRWQGGVATLLSELPDQGPPDGFNYLSYGAGISADGSAIVGWSLNNGSYHSAQFNAAGSFTDLTPGHTTSRAIATNSDGTVIVGIYKDDANPSKGYIWKSGTTTDLPTGLIPKAVSSDGNIIAGVSEDDTGVVATKWISGNVSALGRLPNQPDTYALGMTPDGSVVVGKSGEDGTISRNAVRWTAANGIESIADLLAADGVDISGWELWEAVAVSADGTIVIGNGKDITSGFSQGWIANLKQTTLVYDGPSSVTMTGKMGVGISPLKFTAKLSARDGAVKYSITNVPDWLLVNFSSATLEDGESLTVEFSPNAFTDEKPVGTYGPVSINITNLTNGRGNKTIEVKLIIEASRTTLALAAAPGASGFGQPVQFTATVSATPPAFGTPTGKVFFDEGSKRLGTALLSSGKARFSTTSLSLGSHTITALYGGDDHLAASSNRVSVTVSPKLRAEARVNTFTARAQKLPAIAKLKNGYIVVWASDGQDGSGHGVYGQRYSANGVKQGVEFHVSTATVGHQTVPKVAGLTAGGFVVVWQSPQSANGIFAQAFTAAGAKTGREFQVNTTVSHSALQPAIAGLANGGFVVAWTNDGDADGSGLGVYAQRYDAKAKPLSKEFKVNTTTAGNQSMSGVAGLDNGDFVVVWQGPDANGLGIFGQRYDSSGKALGKQFTVNKTTVKDQSLPSVAGLKGSGFVVVWQSQDQDGPGLGVYGQAFKKDGSKNGVEMRVNTRTAKDQSQPAVSGFSDGGFVVLWTSAGQDGSGKGVYAQAYKATGARAYVEFPINTTKVGDQSEPAVAAAAAGEFMGAWTSRGAAPSLEDVLAAPFKVPLN